MKIFHAVCIIFCLSVLESATDAQSVLAATGDNALGSGGTASYSIGQVIYTINRSVGAGSVVQGVQQPYEISVVSSIGQAELIKLTCSAYPNPAREILNLKIENDNNENLSYYLYEISGQLIFSEKLTSEHVTISLAKLVSSTYFLKIIRTDHASFQEEIKTFKIIKQ